MINMKRKREYGELQVLRILRILRLTCHDIKDTALELVLAFKFIYFKGIKS